MSEKYSRYIKDAELTVTRALPATDEAVTSGDIDLGTVLGAVEEVEVVIEVPALSATFLPSADTLDFVVQNGASATPTTPIHTFDTITGTGSTIAAQQLRCRLPSTTTRYLNVKATAAGGVGDMSASSFIASLRF